MTTAADLATLLIALERELHDPAIRHERARLHALLDAEFVEVGRSGRRYNKASVVAHLAQEPPMTVQGEDFNVALLAPDVALVTYRSAYVQHDGTITDRTWRCSVWHKTGMGWQVRYHQGTSMAQDAR